MKKINHEWSQESLFSKAQIYAEVMLEHQDTNWQFGLWSAFVLEMLIRATVANISPVLIADNKDWNNLLYALVSGVNYLVRLTTITLAGFD